MGIKDFKPRGWEPTDYNPNILRNMQHRSLEEYVKDYAPINERFSQGEEKPSVAFAELFETGYKQALDALKEADRFGTVVEAFKIPPIAARLDLAMGLPGTDVLTHSKFGGVPDLRRQLGFSISHNGHMIKEYNAEKKSPADLLRRI